MNRMVNMTGGDANGLVEKFWQLLDVSVDYDYPNRPGFEGARLTSLRFSNMAGEVFMEAKEQYFVSSMKGVNHGRHYHKEKKEIMHVLRGSFDFTLISPDGEDRLEITLEEGSGKALLVLPGTRHWVKGGSDRALLAVSSSTVHMDEHPDIFPDWPVEKYPQDEL